jgi:WD40 repeat protein
LRGANVSDSRKVIEVDKLEKYVFTLGGLFYTLTSKKNFPLEQLPTDLRTKIESYLSYSDKARLATGARNKFLLSLYKSAIRITYDEVKQLLHHIAFGEQDQALTLIRNDPGLLLHKGMVKDSAKRVFKNVSAFQYAYWALDIHMLDGILVTVPLGDEGNDIRKQLLCQLHEVNTRGLDYIRKNTTVTAERHFNFMPLLNAYGEFIEFVKDSVILNHTLGWHSEWKETAYKRDTLWLSICAEQLKSPIHVIQEFRAGNGFPTSRSGVLVRDVKSHMNRNLCSHHGTKRAIYRSKSGHAHRSATCPSDTHVVKDNLSALKQLFDVRVVQAVDIYSRLFFTTLTKSTGSDPRLTRGFFILPNGKLVNVLPGGVDIYACETMTLLCSIRDKHAFHKCAYTNNNEIISISSFPPPDNAEDYGVIRIWDTNTGKCKEELPAIGEFVSQIEVLPSGDILCCMVFQPPKLIVVNRHTHALTEIKPPHKQYWQNNITSNVIYDAGNILFAIDKTVYVVNAQTYECIKTIDCNQQDVIRAITMHNNRLVTGSLDAKIYLWDIATGRCVQTLPKQLLEAEKKPSTKNHRFRFNISSINVREEFMQSASLPADKPAPLRAVAVLASYGSFIIVGESLPDEIYKEASIHIWNTITGERVQTLTAHGCGLVGLKIDTRGNIISKSADGIIRKWDSLIMANLEAELEVSTKLKP